MIYCLIQPSKMNAAILLLPRRQPNDLEGQLRLSLWKSNYLRQMISDTRSGERPPHAA